MFFIESSTAALQDWRKAKSLAASLCAAGAPVAQELGTECNSTIERYWLSYAYVPGMRWAGEDGEP